MAPAVLHTGPSLVDIAEVVIAVAQTAARVLEAVVHGVRRFLDVLGRSR